MFLFSVCVITIFRLKAVLAFRQADPTYTIWSTVMWSEMEPTLGIICTCAPMMRPIFDKLFAQYRAKRTVGPSSGGYSGLRPSRDAQDSNEHSYPLTALKTHTVIRANNPTGDNLAWHSDLEDSRHHENIRVDSDWEVHHFRV